VVFAAVRTHPEDNKAAQAMAIGQWPVASGRKNRRLLALVFIKNLRNPDTCPTTPDI
jgi:hypothetical protein